MNKIFLALSCFILIVGCSENSVQTPDNCGDHKILIEELEQDFVKSEFDHSLVKGLLISYATFANNCPEDSIAPEYLMRRADLLRGEGKIREAIHLFKTIHDGYPQYSNHITCAFIAAFLYETELNDADMAEKLYLQIIESYPKSHEADISRVSLRHLRETPSEMMERLQNGG